MISSSASAAVMVFSSQLACFAILITGGDSLRGALLKSPCSFYA